MKPTKSNFSLLLIFMVFSGCVSVKIKYDKRKIERIYFDKNYQIKLQGQIIDFENHYLNKNNIKSVVKNRREKTINIEHKTKPKFIGLKDFESDTLSLKDISLVIIEGLVIENENWEKIKFEQNIVKSFEILERDALYKLNWDYPYKGDLMIITIK